MLNVLDILKAANKEKFSNNKTGVKNPIYYAMEKTTGQKIFGKSIAKRNEYKTLDQFKENKLISFPYYEYCIIFDDKESWLKEQIKK